MLDQEFRVCLQYWLGLRLFSESNCSQCGLRVDSYGDHHLHCSGYGDKIFRHDVLHDTIFSAARWAGLSPKLEAPYLILNSSACPVDIYLPSWSDGSPAAQDIMPCNS